MLLLLNKLRYQQRASGKGRDWATQEDGWVEGEVKKFDHPYLQVTYFKYYNFWIKNPKCQVFVFSH
jgi:hypothetical protein